MDKAKTEESDRFGSLTKKNGARKGGRQDNSGEGGGMEMLGDIRVRAKE